MLTSTDADTDSAHNTFGWTAYGTNHQYTLEPADATRVGDAQDYFTMNIATGQLSVKLGAELNHEEQKILSIFVKVTDQNIGGGPAYHPAGVPMSATGEFVVNVLNLNEAPIIDRVGPFYFKKNSAINTVIGTLTATDVDEVNQNGGVMDTGGCCYTFVYRKVGVSVTGTDAATSNPPGNAVSSDLNVNANSGIITLTRNDVDTSSQSPTM